MDSKKIRISHSAINDYRRCPRLYYFKNIYTNPKTGNRIQLASPYIFLGSVVHDSIDELINLPPSVRSKKSLTKIYNLKWSHESIKEGGFISKKQENLFKERGEKMIKKVESSGLLLKRSLKKPKKILKIELNKNLNLVGIIDWVEILPDKSLHIIDFKTGKSKEPGNSLQLLIYYFLAKENYNKKIKKLSYWYLEKDNKPTIKKIEKNKISLAKIAKEGEAIKSAVSNNNFRCSSGYSKCFWCRNYEFIISGKAEYIKIDYDNKKDIYYLPTTESVLSKIYENDFLNEKEKTLFRKRIDGNKKESRIPKKETMKIFSKIKLKLKKNLTPKELKILIKELLKDGV
jgi:RecB family exonuclease